MARLPLLAILAATLAACSPQPCLTCTSVAGTYGETTQFSSVDCQDGRQLFWGQSGEPVQIGQTSNALTVDGPGFSGVLHGDLSADFGPRPSYAIPVDALGNPNPSGQGEPGKLYLDGWFQGSGQASGFNGTYAFIADVDGCEVDSKANWTRQLP